MVSLVFEYGAMYLLYDLLNITYEIPFGSLSLSVSKVLTQFCVIAGNYVLSKLFIFRHEPKSRHDESVAGQEQPKP